LQKISPEPTPLAYLGVYLLSKQENQATGRIAMLSEVDMKKNGDHSQQIANLKFLYRSCAKSKHPSSQEMARRYAQELRQLTGGQGLGIEN
jgi:hypothetical protein